MSTSMLPQMDSACESAKHRIHAASTADATACGRVSTAI